MIAAKRFVLAVLMSSFVLGAASAGQGPPAIPTVVSVTQLGVVQQNKVIYGRDGTFSALIDGKSVWTFGDTPMSVAGVLGNYWDDRAERRPMRSSTTATSACI